MVDNSTQKMWAIRINQANRHLHVQNIVCSHFFKHVSCFRKIQI